MPFAGLGACPQSDEYGGDEGAVDLDAHALLRLRQPVTATENALDPLEKEFDLTAVAIDEPHQFGFQLLEIREEQEGETVGLYTHKAPDRAIRLLAQSDADILYDPCRPIRFAQGALRGQAR